MTCAAHADSRVCRTVLLPFFRVIVACVSAILLMMPAPAAALETVAITEYLDDTSGPETSEWVELFNYGSAPVTMTSWTLSDDDTDSIAIPDGTTIAPKDFLILARDKVHFESAWLGGTSSSRVIQYGPGTLEMDDMSGDEIVLRDGSEPTPQVVWRLAYGPSAVNDHEGRATFYALDDFSTSNTSHGTKADWTVIDRNGNDLATCRLGYEGNEFTTDPYAYAVGPTDFGSPLRGNYKGAVTYSRQPTNWTLSLTTTSKAINPGIRGAALSDQSLDRHDNSDQTGILPTLKLAAGSSLRGVAGGLFAEVYDWRTRNEQPRPSTLQFQRWARDTSCTLYVTVNMRGLTKPDPEKPGFRMFYTTETAVLANMAAEWVRYTNHITQTYQEGDKITDARDAAILNSLKWSSGYVNEFGTADKFTTLPAVGESVPPVKYWEIGNEPNVVMTRPLSISNSMDFRGILGQPTPADYADRYVAITTAMLAEDPSIKVGPCVLNGRPGIYETLLTSVLQTTAPVDFIAYHCYGTMVFSATPELQQGYLASSYSEQQLFLQQVKDLVARYRPAQVDTMEYVGSEVNASAYSSSPTQFSRMSHALGSVECVMSWARLGLTAAHYWLWLTAISPSMNLTQQDYNRLPYTMAYEKMRDKLGDRLIGSFSGNDKVHIHVIGNSTTSTIHVWALNFANSEDITFQLSLKDGPRAANSRITKEVLGAITGPTNLFSKNLAPGQPGGPLREIDWSAPEVLAGADPENLNLALPASTLTLFTIETLAQEPKPRT